MSAPVTSLERVRAALADAACPPTPAASPRARAPWPTPPAAIGVAEGQIVKSMIFVTASGDTLLVLTSGVNRVDERRVAS